MPFKLDYAGVGELLKSAAVRAAVTSKADGIASAARSSAPVDSGTYRDSITVEQDTTDRAVARVVANAPYSMIIESKTGNLARSIGG